MKDSPPGADREIELLKARVSRLEHLAEAMAAAWNLGEDAPPLPSADESLSPPGERGKSRPSSRTSTGKVQEDGELLDILEGMRKRARLAVKRAAKDG